jgi:hypothetical protein
VLAEPDEAPAALEVGSPAAGPATIFEADEDTDEDHDLDDDTMVSSTPLVTPLASPSTEPLATPAVVPETPAPAATDAMSYHAAHTQRGLLIAAQAVAAIGAVVVGLIAINGNLVSYAGIVAALVTLLAVLVVLRTGAQTSRVSLEDGVLDIVHGDNRHRFDLTSDNTTVDVVGAPGDTGWRMLLVRRGLSPVEITARLVDPEPFTEAVRNWRPSV